MDEKSIRTGLLAAQYELKARQSRGLIVLINGVEAAGKGETVKRLSEWMDSRHLRVESFAQPTSQEAQYPAYWRFWQQLPAKGEVALFFGNWYSGLLEDRANKRISRKELAHELEKAQRFEKMLMAEGYSIVKLWFALSEEQLQVRLCELANNPVLRWQVRRTLAWHKPKVFQRYSAAALQLWQAQDNTTCRWHMIDGWDAEQRDLCAATVLLTAMQHALKQDVPLLPSIPLPAVTLPFVLQQVDLTPTLEKNDYQDALAREQARFAALFRSKKMDKRALAIVFEGMDAAGKGGAIRRLTAALDPREYHVMQVSAPTSQQRLYPYLHRFWQKIPAQGQCTIYDRSWYGRVLVERVDNFISEEQWQRAYAEINDFEQGLSADGVIVVKFWLAIDKDVQLARFKERESIAYKRFKITPEDWHNREKWDDYIRAGSEAIARTQSLDHPWFIIPANDKYYARVQVLKKLNEVLEQL